MADSITLRFSASLQSLWDEEKRLATFYLMNTSPNRNGWAVTDKALGEALPTLLGKPLGCVPGYRVDHVHEAMQVGRWVKADKHDGYAIATAEVTDEAAWEKITSGEWGPVSVVIKAYKITCSKCGADITNAPDSHILAGEAHEVVESFVFDRVDFVSDPAYPQAGVITTGPLLGASKSTNGATGSPGKSPKPEEENKLEELNQIRKEVDTLKAEKEGLRGKVEKLEAERREEKVQRALEARARAGLVKDRKQEEERLRKLLDDSLTMLAEDAELLAQRPGRGAAQPKAKFTGEGTDLEAAVEETRLRLFGHGREKT